MILIGIAAVFFAVHTWVYVNAVYHNVPLVDVPMHMLFGAWLALFLFHPRFSTHNKSWFVIFLVIFAAGIAWECIEYVYDHFYTLPRGLPTAQHGILETLRDLASNMFGAGAILPLFKLKFGKFEPIVQQNV